MIGLFTLFNILLGFLLGIFTSKPEIVEVKTYPNVGIYHPELFIVDDQESQAGVQLVRSKREENSLYKKKYRVVLDPIHKTELYAQINSPISHVTKNLGDTFDVGELLIQLENEVYMSNMEKAQAFLEKSEVELMAMNELYRDDMASLYELKNAQATLAEAQANLSLARKNLEATSIRAPFSGRIDALFVEQFELPQTGKALMRVIQDDLLVAKLLVHSQLRSEIYIGQPIAIHLSETGEVIPSRVTRIGGMIDAASSTIRVEAEIQNQSGHYQAGMSGLAVLLFQEEDKRVSFGPGFWEEEIE